VPKRGKTGLEVLGDIKPKGEEDAKEKLEIIPVIDILMSGISLEKGKLSAVAMVGEAVAALISLIREVRAASLRSINNDRSRSPAEELRQQEVEAEAGYEVVGSISRSDDVGATKKGSQASVGCCRTRRSRTPNWVRGIESSNRDHARP